MEKQEENKREEHRRRRQSKSTSSFPNDLTTEILLRLPNKSLARFRCVSKLWSSIIADPYFINLFETRSTRPSLLLCFQKGDNFIVCSIPQHSKISNKSYSFSQPTDCYQIKFPRCDYYQFTESVDGLICFLESDKTPIVWNPSKRQLLALPKPIKMSDDISIFLGYDPIEGKHKLVCVPVDGDCDVCQVLTLGSAQESWRTVKTNLKNRSYKYPIRGRCIKGVIYFEAYIDEANVWIIMSFDVRSEIFDMIEVPSINHVETLINYDGKLAYVKEQQTMEGYSYGTIALCILEDAEKRVWSRKDFPAPLLPHDRSLGTYLYLIGITHAGEFIYAPLRFCESYYILFCDPVRNSYRRFEFKGIADDESWLNHELELNHEPRLDVFPNHNEPQLYVFPNHIESLRSL